MIRDSVLRREIQGDPREQILMLSGGYDSRAIFKTSPNIGHLVTYGEAHSLDVWGAKRVASKSSIAHDFVPYSNWHFGHYAQLVATTFGGSVGLQVAHNLVAFDWIAQKYGAAKCIIGYLGDALTGAHLGQRADVPMKTFFEILIANIRIGDVDWENNIGNAYFEFIEYFYEMIENEKDLNLVQKLQWFDLTIRQSGWISEVFDACNLFCETSYPFYDREFMTTMCSCPSHDLLGQRIYRNWLGNGLFGSLLLSKRVQRWAFRCAIFRFRDYVARVDWRDALARSGTWLDSLDLDEIEIFDDATKDSYRNYQNWTGAMNAPPTFLNSIPAQQKLSKSKSLSENL